MFLQKKSTGLRIFGALILAFSGTFAFADLENDLPEEKPKKEEPKLVPMSSENPSSSEKKEGGAKPNPKIKKEKRIVSKETSNKSKGNEQSGEDQHQPIFFSGDTLVGLRKKGVLEIKDNVDVKQGSLKLTAQQAKIFFDATEQVEKVVAKGNVHIRKVDDKTKEEIVAQGESVEFLAIDQIIVLEGNASLKRAEDTVRGSLIRYYMLNGKIEAEKVKGVVKAQEDYK